MPDFRAMEENLRATLSVFGRAKAAGETREFPGVTVTSSDVVFPMFNAAVLTAPVSTAGELDDRIGTAARFFGERGLAWSFWVCQDWIAKDALSKVGIVFERNGLHLVIELPGMAAEQLVPPSHPLPALTIHRVSDEETRGDFSHIMSIAFGIPGTIAQAIYGSERTWLSGFKGYVGYAEDLAVSSAAVIVTGPVAGVYAVGTLPAYEHRGFAEAMMRHAIERVTEPEGIEYTVLQSSEAGFSLYKKMGYRAMTRYAVFAT